MDGRRAAIGDGDGFGGGTWWPARERERRQVRGAVRDGRPVVVTGPGGSGLTTLVREALAGLPVAWGGGLAAVRHRPFVALERALDDAAPPGDAGAVAAWAEGRLGRRVLVVGDLHVVHPATLAALTRLAGRVPVVATFPSGVGRALAPGRAVGRWPGDPLVVTLAERPPAAGGTAPCAGLTDREQEVLALVASGHTTPQIARRLGITRHTVESHVRSTRTKLGVPTRTAAAAQALAG